MNFFDLCVALGRAIGRGFAALGRLFARMIRLTYRYWWLVITLVIIAIAAALYTTRKENISYRVNAVAFLNGASIQQFEQAYALLRNSQQLPTDAAILPFIKRKQVGAFETYRVVDCLDDGVADYIDFKHKSSPTDTIKVQMDDRLCLQFRIKKRDMHLLPEIEAGVLDVLNGDEAMQKSYAGYIANLREEVAFDHRQAQKLDSLTSSYYFNNTTPVQPTQYSGNGVNFYGDRRIHLFLDEIYEQQKHMQQNDYRLQLATAPVVLENHFAVDKKPVMSRRQTLAIFILLSWCIGCLLAEVIDQRKAICAWLKR